jgi:hypothetical protein
MMIAARITILTTDQIAICVVVQPVVFASLSDEIAAGRSEASRYIKMISPTTHLGDSMKRSLLQVFILVFKIINITIPIYFISSNRSICFRMALSWNG